MRMKVFLYGKRNAGKSTMIQEAARRCGIVPVGFRTVCDRDGYEGGWNLHLQPASGPAVFTPQNRVAVCHPDGSWESYPYVFDSEGVRLLTFAREPRLVVMDEIGFMEKDSERFQAKVMEILDSPCPVLGVIKPAIKGPGPFIERVHAHPGVEVMEITAENRNERLLKIIGKLEMHVSRGG
jgi:nucleoside-triphosphatase